MVQFKVYKITKKGSKFDSEITGKNWRQAWEYYKRAGHFTSGRYIVVDSQGRDHYVTH